MNYNKTSYVLALFTAIAIFSGSGFKLGPAQVRLFDFGIIILIITFVLSDTRLVLRREYLFFYIVFGFLLTYAVLLLPFQPYSQTATILQIVELAEYLIVFSVFSSFLADESTTEHKLILDTALWVTVIGSTLSIIAFFTLGVRPVLQWYVFGLPAFGVYYAAAKYAAQGDWYYLIIILILLLRILVGQSRSMYLFIPLAALFTLIYLNVTGPVIKFRKISMIKTIPTVGIPLVGTFLIFPSLQNRVISIIQVSQGFLSRPARWIAGLNVFKQHPFGIGLGNYATAVQNLALKGEISYPSWFVSLFGSNRIEIELSKYRVGNAGPHSDLFRLLVELGFVGLASIIVFWILLMKRILNHSMDKLSISLAATMVYLIFQQLVNSQLFTGSGGIIFTLFFAIFSTYGLASNREKDSL